MVKDKGFDTITSEEFDDILRDVVHDHGTEALMAIGDIYSLASEEFNNEVLEEWAQQNGRDTDTGLLLPDEEEE